MFLKFGTYVKQRPLTLYTTQIVREAFESMELNTASVIRLFKGRFPLYIEYFHNKNARLYFQNLISLSHVLKYHPSSVQVKYL